MKCFPQLVKLKNLYIFFFILALLNIFFSTENSNAKTFLISEIEISTPFNDGFDKNEIINESFVKAYTQLILLTAQSIDVKKLTNIPIKQIKGLVETFSIKEEKFIDEVYYLTLDVSFNKKNFFDLLESKNIFPSLLIKKNLMFIPIIVDEDTNQILLFSENQLFKFWNSKKQKYHLLNYILPNEDIEDFNLIKRNIKNLENYDFNSITKKYNFDDYIIMIIFKNNQGIRVLNKIVFNKNKNIKNFKFKNLNLNNLNHLDKFIKNQKLVFEDYWKLKNQINTSIKLNLTISVDNSNNVKINQLEEHLSNIELIYNFNIFKFDNKKNVYKIIFNGTREKFLEIMRNKNYTFQIKNKVWVLE